MTPDVSLFSLDDLPALMASGPAPVEFSPLGDAPLLCLRLDGPAPTQEQAAWLRSLVCPVLGVGPADAPGARAVDVRVDEPARASAIASRVAANPTAATVFVQLLRRGGALDVDAALRMESLAYATLQAGAEYAAWLAQQGEIAPPPVESGPVVEVRRDGARLEIVLNRPANRNAMSVQMRDGLQAALLQALDDDALRLHISARGKCFSTGGDLSEFGSVPDAATGHIVRGLRLPGALLARCAARTTARVHGACIGSGIEFPAFAGHVVAHPKTHFQLPEIGMGLIPGAGGTLSIARRIGRQRTAWLGLSGKRLRADQALAWGLVDALEEFTPDS